MCDYFDDEIDDQPDLTLNENDQPSYHGTPATEFPPTNFGNLLNKSQKIVNEMVARVMHEIWPMNYF